MKRFIVRLVLFAERHAWYVVATVCVLTLALGSFALRIRADTSIDKLIPRDAEVERLTAKYGSENVAGDYLLLLFLGRDLFTPARLAQVAEACAKISELQHVRAGLTPFNFPHFENRGGRLALAPMSPGSAPPATVEAAEALRGRLLDDAQARNLIISADGEALCAIYPVDTVEDHRPLLAAAEKIVEPLRRGMDVRISGILPVHQALLDNLYRDLPTFLLLALSVVLVSYYFSFRTLRAVLLTVLVVVIGTIWTVGTMTLLGFRLSVVLVMTPPLVLILGSSYSLHTLNQYYREVVVSGESRKWIAESVQNVSVTIFLASITTVCGFLSLVTCSLSQVRQFGIATALGIAYCALLALFFLPSVLSLLPSPTQKQRDRVVGGTLALAMGRLGGLVVRGRWVILGVSLAITATFALTVGRVRYDTNFLRYLRYREPAIESSQLLVDRFTGFEYLYLTLLAPEDRPGYFQEPAILSAIGRYEDALLADPDVKYLASFTGYLRSMNRALTDSFDVPSTRPLVLLLSRYFSALSTTPVGKSLTGVLMNRDATRYTIQLHVWDHRIRSLAFEASLEQTLPRLQAKAREMLPAAIELEYWGETITVLSAARLMSRDQVASILSSALLISLVSALVFRSIRHGLLVLVPMAAGIMVNFIVMGVSGIPLDALTITFASIAIGIGVDNAIHLTIWHRRLDDPALGVAERRLALTLATAGRPIVLTTLSIVAALLVFTFSRFRPIVYFGVLVSLSLIMTTLASLVLLPALLYFGGRRREATAGRRGRRRPRWKPLRVAARRQARASRPPREL